jgi:hypothetical protein
MQRSGTSGCFHCSAVASASWNLAAGADGDNYIYIYIERDSGIGVISKMRAEGGLKDCRKMHNLSISVQFATALNQHPFNSLLALPPLQLASHTPQHKKLRPMPHFTRSPCVYTHTCAQPMRNCLHLPPLETPLGVHSGGGGRGIAGCDRCS